MTNKKDPSSPATAATELSDAALDDASGGLLLPAVQKVREAAARAATLAPTQLADGSIRSTVP